MPEKTLPNKTMFPVTVNITKSYLLRCGRNACPVQYTINSILNGIREDAQMRIDTYGVPAGVRVDITHGILKYSWDMSGLKPEPIEIPTETLAWLRAYYDMSNEARDKVQPIKFDTVIPIYADLSPVKKSKLKGTPSIRGYSNVQRIQEEEEMIAQRRRQAAMPVEQRPFDYDEDNPAPVYIGTPWGEPSSWHELATRYEPSVVEDIPEPNMDAPEPELNF